jgi:hypothetical protein
VLTVFEHCSNTKVSSTELGRLRNNNLLRQHKVATSSWICHIRLSRKKVQESLPDVISTEVSSLATQNKCFHCVATIPEDKVCTTSAERTQGQASFHYGELPVVKRRYRVRMQASSRCFLCSAIWVENLRRQVALSGQHGSERPEQFSINAAEQEDVDASLHWTL